MKEQGLVVSLKGNLATVRVQRQAASRGCCHFDTVENVLIEASNLCKASVNDKVFIESGQDKMTIKYLLQISLGILLFVFGLAVGDVIARVLNFGSMKELISFAIGILFAAISFQLVQIKNKNVKELRPIIIKILD